MKLWSRCEVRVVLFALSLSFLSDVSAWSFVILAVTVLLSNLARVWAGWWVLWILCQRCNRLNMVFYANKRPG